MAKIKDIKKHPENMDMVKKINQTDDRSQFVKDLMGKVSKDSGDQETRNRKLSRWYKKRYGIRPTQKTFPWPGASNTHVFLVDEKIRRMKPNYLNIAFEGDPVVNFHALGNTPNTSAQSAELLMDWILKYQMNQYPGVNYFRGLALIVDRMLEKGKGFAKVIWEYRDANTNNFIDIENIPEKFKEVIHDPLVDNDTLLGVIFMLTELRPDIDEDMVQAKRMVGQFQAGERIIKYKARTEIYNGPRVVAVDDKDIIIPPFTTDIQSAIRITHIIQLTENDIAMGARSGKYDKKVAQEILDTRKDMSAGMTEPRSEFMTTEELQTLKRQREGVGEFKKDSELFEVWEIYTWYDIDGDGVKEKVVITIDRASRKVLRFIEFPYNHYKWPFVVFDYEYNDDRFYSQRGLPELLDHYQTIVTNQENAKLDRMVLANSLQFKYRIGGVNPKNIRFIPSQGIPVHRMDDVQPLDIQNLDISFDTEMAKIRGLAESYIGQPDLDVSSLSSSGGDRRTAFEVSEMVSLGRQIFSFDARLFKDSLSKLYDQIFELWLQYGPDSVEVKITGGEPLVISKPDVIGNFVIVPAGDFTLLSRTLELNKAFQTLQMAVNDQDGVIDKYNAWENYLIKYDPKGAKNTLNDRGKYEQFQQIKAQQQAVNTQIDLIKAGRIQPPTGNAQGGEGERIQTTA